MKLIKNLMIYWLMTGVAYAVLPEEYKKLSLSARIDRFQVEVPHASEIKDGKLRYSKKLELLKLYFLVLHDAVGINEQSRLAINEWQQDVNKQLTCRGERYLDQKLEDLHARLVAQDDICKPYQLGV